MANNTNIYPIQLLNDLHNWFPDVLYNPGRFRTVQDLLEYIRQGADVNPYTRGLQIYRGRTTPLTSSVNRQPSYTTPPARSTRVPVIHTPARAAVGATNTAQINEFNNLNNLNNVFSNMITTPITTSVRTFPLETLFTDEISMNMLSQLLTPTLQSFLSQTVQVAPTAEELRNATTVLSAPHTFEDNCAICQDLMEETQQLRRINHCGHSFHKQCIDTWFGTNVHCPTCRHDIREVSTAPEPTTTSTNAPPPVPDNHRRTNIRENNTNS